MTIFGHDCIHTYLHTYIHTYIHRIYVYIYMYIYIYIYIHTQTCIYTHRLYIYIYIYIYTYINGKLIYSAFYLNLMTGFVVQGRTYIQYIYIYMKSTLIIFYIYKIGKCTF